MTDMVTAVMGLTTDAQPTLSPQRVLLHGVNYHLELNDSQVLSSAQCHLSSKLIYPTMNSPRIPDLP